MTERLARWTILSPAIASLFVLIVGVPGGVFVHDPFVDDANEAHLFHDVDGEFIGRDRLAQLFIESIEDISARRIQSIAFPGIGNATGSPKFA